MAGTVGHRLDVDGSNGRDWAVFAATIIALTGVLNVVYGIAAIGGSDFFAEDTGYVLAGLETYGWLLLIVGAVQLLAGVGSLMHVDAARWAGITLAGLNAVAQMLWIPAEPILSLALFGLDVLIIYALLARGRQVATR